MEEKINVLNEIDEKTVMITGASGLVGSRLVKKLLEERKGVTVVALVRNAEKAKKVLADYLQNPRFILRENDVCQPIDYEGDVDYMIHTAGITGGSKQHIDYPMRTINTALQGTVNVLDYARDRKVKGVVYLSSLEVYGKSGVESLRENDGGYIDPTNVRSSYSESKRMCECICAAYAKQFGVRVMIARLAATFGPGVSYADNRVFAQFARSVMERQDIVLKSTGDTVRNYCDVDDCADALLLLLEKGESGEAYNIANEATEISIKDLAQQFIRLFPESAISLKFDLSVDATKFGYNETRRTVLNSEKIRALGWKPKFSLEDTLLRLVDSMKKLKE